jgi:hypothetical protein
MTHIVIVGLFLLVMVLILIILVVFVIVLIEFSVEVILVVKFLKRQGISSEPIDGTRNQLLLDILTKLVIKLKTFLDVRSGILIILRGCLGGREEVEERLRRDSLLDDAGLLSVCDLVSAVRRKNELIAD